MDMFSLKGKAVVVTGGGRGIGRGITRAMAKAGANIVITGRGIEPLREAEAEAQSLGAKVLVVQSDITRAEDLARIVKQATETFGYIDCWVNNAGSADPRDVGPMIDMTEDRWDRVVDLNFKWTFFAAQAAARAMKDRGGSIIFISSRSGSIPNPNTGQYGASKAGIENLVGTLAVEWGHMQIRVNAISPGVVLTSAEGSSSMVNAARRKRQIETVPLRRLGHVDDVGPLCVYFAADESAWVSGSVVQVTGGSRLSVGTLSYLYHINKMMDAKEELEARKRGRQA